MEHFTPVSGLVGGLLIGLAVTLLLTLNGRIGGISGIIGGLLTLEGRELELRAAVHRGPGARRSGVRAGGGRRVPSLLSS
jgi:uncharacterized membrane protein YedE/YeeE